VVHGAVDGAGAGGTGAQGDSHRAVFTGDARTATVAEARRWARGVLTAWDADELEWELSQLLTEVVTNAVLHAGTSLRVGLEQDAASGRLRCEVTDGSPVRPRLRNHSAEATTGRGLQLLETVAASWGVQPASAGKTVWFELDGEGGGRGERPGGEDLAALLEELASGEAAVEGGGKGAVARGSTPPTLALARWALPPAWAGAAAFGARSFRPASIGVAPCPPLPAWATAA
jgi:anti-sigma regulatory factor (Ser/Thr protein kinase)